MTEPDPSRADRSDRGGPARGHGRIAAGLPALVLLSAGTVIAVLVARSDRTARTLGAAAGRLETRLRRLAHRPPGPDRAQSTVDGGDRRAGGDRRRPVPATPSPAA